MATDSTKKDYEIAFLCPEETGPEEVRKLIARSGGEILLEGPAEKIALAYKIGTHTAAYFGYLHFAAEPGVIPPLERDLNTHSHVLRFLIITPPFVKAKSRGPGKPKGRAPVEGQAPVEKKPVPGLPLSNEALEKKIEEILQQ